MQSKRVDLPFLVSIIILIAIGTLIFWSASLGLVARDPARYAAALSKQIMLGLLPGALIAYGLSKIPSNFWRNHSIFFFVVAFVVNILVFIPGIGFSHGGAVRWLDIGPLSFQPSELLKIGAIIAYAAWLSAIKSKITEWKLGIIPLGILVGLTGVVLLLQPDNDTFAVIGATLVIMHLLARAPWRDFAIIGLIGVLLVGVVFITRPYVRERITTLFQGQNTTSSLTSSYQIDQALIAIGSGGVFGRGFGKGIQKFGFLPEPVGDSIFAVAGEEFGLMGTMFIIGAFVYFILRAYTIALRTDSRFSSYALIGLSTSIFIQSFINISSMTGIIPISGIPLVFASQGGSSLLISLISVGIMLGLSRGVVGKAK
jgi:cell division protein FtsW